MRRAMAWWVDTTIGRDAVGDCSACELHLASFVDSLLHRHLRDNINGFKWEATLGTSELRVLARRIASEKAAHRCSPNICS